MSILKALLLLNITVLISCSNSNFQDSIEATNSAHIWGGEIINSPKSEIFRSTVLIVVKYSDENGASKIAICTGVALSQRHVLTAAHCVQKKSPTMSNITHNVIQLIDVNKVTPKDYIKVIDYKINDEYSSSSNAGDEKFDLAVLLLQRPLVKSVPIKIYDDSSLDYSAKELFISGYGSYDEGKVDFRLRTTQVKLADRAKGKDIFFEPLKGCSLHGDSGGPAYFIENGKPVIFGISSSGLGDLNELGPCQKYMRYSLVNEYRDFISNAVKKLK